MRMKVTRDGEPLNVGVTVTRLDGIPDVVFKLSEHYRGLGAALLEDAA